jgi:predicted PurR-regulated permease PerM
MKSEWSETARYFTLALVIAFVVFIAYQAREVVRALILAGVIAYLLYPFVSLLQRHAGLKRRTASSIVYFASLAVMLALPVVLIPVLSRQFAEITSDLQVTLEQAQRYLAQPIVIGGMTMDLGLIISQYKFSLSGLITPAAQNPILLIRNTTHSTLLGLIVIVGVYFFMTEWENLREGLVQIAPEAYREDARRLYQQIRQVWMAYLRGQLTLMLIVAVTFIIVWTIIGLPGSLYLGILAGLFSIVPDVGPFVATLLALAVALLEGSTRLPVDNFVFGIIVVGIYVVLINLKGIWLRPLILGRSVHMNEAVVFISIVAAVIFTGILGAFIIVPVLASLAVIWKYLHARMLGLPPFPDDAPASDPDAEAASARKSESRTAAKSVKKKSPQ